MRRAYRRAGRTLVKVAAGIALIGMILVGAGAPASAALQEDRRQQHADTRR
jgi:hypothetical protein